MAQDGSTSAHSAARPVWWAGVGPMTAAVMRAWRRVPFTTAVVAVMLAVAVGTGGLWDSVQDRSWYSVVAYGVPSLRAGRWWTPVTGSFLAATPLAYLPVVVGFAVLVGYTEARLGTRRTVAVTVPAQLFAVLAAAAVVAVLSTTAWPWAHETADQLDVGFTAGALAAAAVASATVRAPWRFRLQVGLCVLVGVGVVYIGSFADVVRLFAVMVALPLARTLAGPGRAAPRSRPSRREWRLLAVAGVGVIAAVQVVILLWPGDTPLGQTAGTVGSFVDVVVPLAVLVILGNGLRRGRRVAWRWTVAIAVLVVAVELVTGMLVIIAEVFDLDYRLEGVPLFVADGVLWAAELWVLIVARRAFRVPSRRKIRRTAPTADPATAAALLQRHGGNNLSWMTTWPENLLFVRSDGQGCVAYRRHAGVAVAVGDPIGPAGTGEVTVREFARMCDRSGLVPCMFSVTTDGQRAAAVLGWQSVQVAEDTVIDLEGLEFRGKAWQDVRSAMNRAAKDGVRYRLVTLAEQSRGMIAQVRAISDEWVGDKGMPEMGFTLGGVDEALDPHTRVGLAIDAADTVQGVTSWMPVYAAGGHVQGWTLDLMRRRTDGFRPVIEFLIASSCLALREHGARFVSLSGAPLARAPGDRTETTLERLLETLGAAMEPYYGFRSLHAFKMKFQPRHEAMFLTYRDAADLPRIGVALGRAYLPDAGPRDLLHLTRSTRA